MVAGLTNGFDGAWHAIFAAQLGGEGIVLLRNGSILGCVNQYFYEGSYELDGAGTFKARVKVSHYAGDRVVSISWRVRAVCDSVRASRLNCCAGVQDSNGRLQLKGDVTGDPDRRLAVILTRLVPKVTSSRVCDRW